MAERISSESLDWFVYELEKEEEQEVEFLEALDKIMEEANSFVEGPDAHLPTPCGKPDREDMDMLASKRQLFQEDNDSELAFSEQPRFATLPSAEDLERMKKPFVPKNTMKNNKWATKNFEDWIVAHNKADSENSCPRDILENCSDPQVLCSWLCKFVVSTRASSGREYTPSTLHSLLAGLRRHVKEVNPLGNMDSFNFMAKENPYFQELQATCDHVYRDLRKKGVGAKMKHAAILTKEDEDQLWVSGTMGTGNPTALLNAVFFYNGKNFHLRGGEEHRNLKLSQVQRLYNPDRYIYIENGSKNRQGGINDIRVENKNVPVIANPDAGNRCHVYLLDLYLSKVPPAARQIDTFYLNPAKNEDKDAPWYRAQPLGKNKLGSLLKSMCKKAEIDKENITNHSLRASGTTELFRSGVPEHVIKERTGHRSLDALRQYERTSTDQHAAVSKILTNPATSHWDKQTAKPVTQCLPFQDSSRQNQATACINSVTMQNCKVIMFPQPPTTTENDDFDEFIKENINLVDF